MKKASTIFLQIVIVLFGLGVLTFLLWGPHLEGRNVNATAFEIYFKDPFLAYVYISSFAFFTILYQAFKSLGFVRQNKTFTEENVKALRTIKYSAITQSILIAGAGSYIRIFHTTEDDPAGFLALCIITIFISLVIASAAGMFEKVVQNGTSLKSENDLTV